MHRKAWTLNFLPPSSSSLSLFCIRQFLSYNSCCFVPFRKPFLSWDSWRRKKGDSCICFVFLMQLSTSSFSFLFTTVFLDNQVGPWLKHLFVYSKRSVRLNFSFFLSFFFFIYWCTVCLLRFGFFWAQVSYMYDYRTVGIPDSCYLLKQKRSFVMIKLVLKLLFFSVA